MGKKTLIAVAFAIFVVGVVANFPARVAYQWASIPGVDMSGIEGTVWRGSAAEVMVNGAYLKDLTWENNSLSLLILRLSYDIDATPPSGFMQANLTTEIGGKTTLSDVTASVPIAWFARGAGIPGLSGTSNLKFERVVIQDGFFTAADGDVQTLDLKVPLLGPNSLGSYSAKFFTQDEGVSASIEDIDAIIDLAGSLQVSTERSFVFDAKIVTTARTPENLSKQLKQFYPANPRGQHEIRLEGTL